MFHGRDGKTCKIDSFELLILFLFVWEEAKQDQAGCICIYNAIYTKVCFFFLPLLPGHPRLCPDCSSDLLSDHLCSAHAHHQGGQRYETRTRGMKSRDKCIEFQCFSRQTFSTWVKVSLLLKGFFSSATHSSQNALGWRHLVLDFMSVICYSA